MFGWLKRLLRRPRDPVGLVFTNEEADRARHWAESYAGDQRLYTGADGKPKILLPRPWE